MPAVIADSLSRAAGVIRCGVQFFDIVYAIKSWRRWCVCRGFHALKRTTGVRDFRGLHQPECRCAQAQNISRRPSLLCPGAPSIAALRPRYGCDPADGGNAASPMAECIIWAYNALGHGCLRRASSHNSCIEVVGFLYTMLWNKPYFNLVIDAALHSSKIERPARGSTK